tara:strand:+ start:337 stop:585 length:249 start_codon:yes stop_codon:yes gene_type:complete
MSVINNKFVITISKLEMSSIIRSLKLYDDLSTRFKDESKKGVVRLLIDDLLQIEQNGPQVDKNCEIQYSEADVLNMLCEECE